MDMEPIKVLLIEDNVGDCKLILKMFETSEVAKFELTHTSRLTSGLKLLESEKFDIILLDLGLPDSVGFESFKSTLELHPAIPIIILTGISK